MLWKWQSRQRFNQHCDGLSQTVAIRPEAVIRGHVQTTLHVNHAPQKRLLKKRVASPNPASCKSF